MRVRLTSRDVIHELPIAGTVFRHRVLSGDDAARCSQQATKKGVFDVELYNRLLLVDGLAGWDHLEDAAGKDIPYRDDASIKTAVVRALPSSVSQTLLQAVGGGYGEAALRLKEAVGNSEASSSSD